MHRNFFFSKWIKERSNYCYSLYSFSKKYLSIFSVFYVVSIFLILLLPAVNLHIKAIPIYGQNEFKEIKGYFINDNNNATSIQNGTASIQQPILIKNVHIFDSKTGILTNPTSVLIKGNKIAEIHPSINVTDATVIDGSGKTVTPGFIDIHSHVMMQLPIPEYFRTDQLYHALFSSEIAKLYLSNGYTTIRDEGGNAFSLKKAIDESIVEGPRIYPSGPMISQSAGHADHRSPNEPSTLIGGQQDLGVKYGDMLVVDGVPDVLKAVRDTLRQGASQIKIAVGGGTGSEADPLDVTEYTPEEIHAAVEAAADWNTYVSAHVYNPDGIRRAIDNGVKVIEHGNLVDEPTLQYMKEKGIWLSPQVTAFTFIPHGYTEDQKQKHEQALAGIDNMFTIAKKIGFDKIGFGSDIITSPEMLKKINDEFVYRTKWFTPSEIMQQATYKNGQILSLSGPRNPYPGTLGVIQQDALADLLLINGNPISNISILTDPGNIMLIMKDGIIYNNTLS